MNLDDIFRQRKKRWNTLIKYRKNIKTVSHKCPKCETVMEGEHWKENFMVCEKCNYHYTLSAVERIDMLCDQGSFREKFKNVQTGNPLNFPGYEEKIRSNQRKSGLEEAFLCGSARINSVKVALGVLDSQFLMGSMGTVVGEKICRLAEYAGKRKVPLIIFSASGGARMQEGLFSLMQMANTSAAVERFKNQGGLFISYLTNPTSGGVSASYASLGDIILAEPDALICFAGPRVIKQTIGQTLPEGFQHAEFLLEHGMLDMIVERKDMRQVLSKLIMLHRR